MRFMFMEEDDSENEKLKGFLQWAAELGISDSPPHLHSQLPKHSCLGHSLAVAHFQEAGGRGLAAIRSIGKGELVLRVPKSALLTRGSLLEDDQTLSLALRRHSSLCPTQVFAVCLLYEMAKGKRSRWYLYLMSLPRNYELLASFSQFEKQALQVDDAIWTTEKAVTKAESQWKEATPLMEELKLQRKFCSFLPWIWASSTISSRTLHIHWDEAGCLCPVGDLFNYAAPGEESKGLENSENWLETSSFRDGSLSVGDATDTFFVEQTDAPIQSLTDAGFEEEHAAYCFYARRNYRMGEQVLLSYGTYTNLELLEHHGFLLNQNPNDKVFIPLELNVCSNSWPTESMFIHPDGKPSFALSSALRLWATPPSQRRSVRYLAYSGAQLSADNEISVMKWILKKCDAILSDLPTTLEEDTSLLLTIDETQNVLDLMELRRVLCSSGSEAATFFEANLKCRSHEELLSSCETRRLMERWKLAVQWRCMYKKILKDCISYCTEVISSFQSEKKSGFQHLSSVSSL